MTTKKCPKCKREFDNLLFMCAEGYCLSCYYKKKYAHLKSCRKCDKITTPERLLEQDGMCRKCFKESTKERDIVTVINKDTNKTYKQPLSEVVAELKPHPKRPKKPNRNTLERWLT